LEGYGEWHRPKFSLLPQGLSKEKNKRKENKEETYRSKKLGNKNKNLLKKSLSLSTVLFSKKSLSLSVSFSKKSLSLNEHRNTRKTTAQQEEHVY